MEAKRKPRQCLVLNADGRPLSSYPLSIIPSEDAIHAWFRDRVNIVENWDGEFFHSPSTKVPVPKTVILRHYAPVNSHPKFCRRSILLRDRFSCFVAGTRILAADGRQLEIESILPGDRLIDAFGKPVTVVRVGERISDDCVSIKHRGSFERMIVTSDHPFLQDDGHFVQIDKIDITERRGGGMLRMPRIVEYSLPEASVINLSTFLPRDKWFRLRNGRIFCSRHTTAQGTPITIQQSSDLAYLLGLWVAEGHTTKQGCVGLSFCSDEEHTIAEDAKRLLEDLFGVRAWKRVEPENHVCSVRCSSKALALIIEATCGKGAKNKKTPWPLIGPYHADYLRGLFAGDAYFHDERKKIALTMAGQKAILGAQSMLWGFGIHPSLQYLQLDGKLPTLTLVLNARNRSEFMTKIMNKPTEQAEEIYGDESHVYRSLQERERLEGDFIVYNIEVDGSHSYIANGIAVHNCQYCGEKFPSEQLTFDHVTPRSKGGCTTWDNILTACLKCNSGKASNDANLSGRKKDGTYRPLKMPKRPSSAELLRAGLEFLPNEVRENWNDFLYWQVPLLP